MSFYRSFELVNRALEFLPESHPLRLLALADLLLRQDFLTAFSVLVQDVPLITMVS